MKMTELITLEQCGKRYQFDKLGIITSKGKSYYMSIAMKEVIKKLLLLSPVEYEDFVRTNKVFTELNSLLSDNLFVPLAKEEEITILASQIIRYTNYIKAVGGTIISKDIVQDINIGGKLITVSADMIIQHAKGIEIVKIKRKEPKLSYAARTFSNIPKNSIELYLLQTLGEHLYPGKAVMASFHHLTAKNDKNGFIPYFETKKGHNIIGHLFKQEEATEIVKRINDLFDMSKSNKFLKTCEISDCKVCSYRNICHYKKNQVAALKRIKEVKKAPKDFSLTNLQRKAVMFENGIVRINAGAGSGKTTVVALRVVELVLSGCEPEDILLITFTNKGAAEMRDKISYWLKQEGIELDLNRFNIYTFNSWGDGIVQDKYQVLGYNAKPTLIEKVEKYDIIFDLLKNNDKLEGYDYKNPLMNFRYAKGVVVRLENIFNYIKAYNVSYPSQLVERNMIKEDADKVFDLYNKYTNILKEKNFIEYQDQINLILHLISEHPHQLDKYDYKHLIIDEFQDSASAELDLILFLSNQPKFESLMIVGDDSQSIFGFRNTSQDNILNFHLYFDEVQDINMIENFRSTPEIIKLANAINDLNTKKINKKLVSGLKHGDSPQLISFSNYETEYSFIAKKIKELLDNNKPEDFAIIARTKNELFNMEEYLKDENIPYIIDIPEPLLNNTNIHIAESLLTFIDDLKTTQGLLEYLFVITDEYKGMNEVEIKKMVEDKAEEISDEIGLSEAGEETKLNYFYSLLEEIKDDDFEKFLKGLKDKNLPFDKLRDYLHKFIEYEDNKTIEKTNDKYSAVTLTTAHTSKGKEFKIVFNTISRYEADVSVEAKDEERRLLFVSMTRAKEKLFITHQKYNSKKINSPLHPFALEIAKTSLCKVSEM